jgi:hypothetical protein
MKNLVAMKVVFLAGLLLTITWLSLSIAGGARWSLAAQGSGGQDADPNERIAVRDALRRGGIREAARLKGHYVREFDPHWDFGRFDIEALVRGSEAVLVGVPTSTLSGRLTAEGQLILTDYEVSVQEVIKGEIKPGEVVTVALVGGRISFEDGTSAEVKTPQFDHIKTGRVYVFFLSERKSGSEAYFLTGGPQGLVEIVDSTTIKSHGRLTDPIAEESRLLNRDGFLREVRKLGKQWPQPGKCCT